MKGGLLVLALALNSMAAADAGVPQRVFDTKRAAWSDFDAMTVDLSGADVVIVGEQHGDPNTHALERTLLDALSQRRADLVLSLEMFERDTQPALDAYLAGALDEAAFLERTRPWPKYQTDYRPLVEFARERRLPVIAANVPRPLAQRIAREGLEAIKSLTAEQQEWLPAEMRCPRDAYFDRFAKSMSNHPGGGGTGAAVPQDTVDRYYFAQCLKDEVMAEWVARAAKGPGEGPLVVHYNGAFHSDFGLGAAERVRRRLPGSRVVVVSVLPVASLDGIDPGDEDRARADYLIYTTTSKRPQ